MKILRERVFSRLHLKNERNIFRGQRNEKPHARGHAHSNARGHTHSHTHALARTGMMEEIEEIDSATTIISAVAAEENKRLLKRENEAPGCTLCLLYAVDVLNDLFVRHSLRRIPARAGTLLLLLRKLQRLTGETPKDK